MSEPKCPGQDQRFWKPEDIFDVICPSCGSQIEFWKDEPVRTCNQCNKPVRNPRLDLGCAKWCQKAGECLGRLPPSPPPDSST
jgi:predicted amidophosphoribosyltransferase